MTQVFCGLFMMFILLIILPSTLLEASVYWKQWSIYLNLIILHHFYFFKLGLRRNSFSLGENKTKKNKEKHKLPVKKKKKSFRLNRQKHWDGFINRTKCWAIPLACNWYFQYTLDECDRGGNKKNISNMRFKINPVDCNHHIY